MAMIAIIALVSQIGLCQIGGKFGNFELRDQTAGGDLIFSKGSNWILVGPSASRDIPPPPNIAEGSTQFIEGINQWFAVDKRNGVLSIGRQTWSWGYICKSLDALDTSNPNYIGIRVSPRGSYLAISYLSKRLASGDAGEQAYLLSVFKLNGSVRPVGTYQIGFDSDVLPSWVSDNQLVARAEEGGFQLMNVNSKKVITKRQPNVSNPWGVNGSIYWLSYEAQGKWSVRNMSGVVGELNVKDVRKRPALILSSTQKDYLLKLSSGTR